MQTDTNTDPATPARVPKGVPPAPDPTLRLSMPEDGIRDGELVVRLPRAEDVGAIAPAFADAELREAGNLPELSPEDLLETLPYLPALAASGRLLPVIVVDATRGEIVGGGALHHLDSERAIVEIGYWVLPHARGRGVATRVARMLAEHAFSLGVQRVEGHVNVGNDSSDRVLERAGFTREGVVRSLPRPDGRRGDKTLYSLLPGE
jgi:RimJ/RimL family protein N-acetyltransferase